MTWSCGISYFADSANLGGIASSGNYSLAQTNRPTFEEEPFFRQGTQVAAGPLLPRQGLGLLANEIATGDVPMIGSGAVKAGAKLANGVAGVAKSGAESAKQAADLSRHLGYTEKYGQAGVKELESGRVRYYGELQPANKAGEMAGRRYVHEFDPATGGSRGWHETLDHSGNVRQVRPELNNGGNLYGINTKEGSAGRVSSY